MIQGKNLRRMDADGLRSYRAWLEREIDTFGQRSEPWAAETVQRRTRQLRLVKAALRAHDKGLDKSDN